MSRLQGQGQRQRNFMPSLRSPHEKARDKTDSRLSETESVGKMQCYDCKGYVSPTEQPGRKSNTYWKADLPGEFDPIVRMPDGPPEYYCPICNKKLLGEPKEYERPSPSTPAQKKAYKFGCIGWVAIVIVLTVGVCGLLAELDDEDDESPGTVFALIFMVGMCAVPLWRMLGPDWRDATDAKASE